MGRKHLRVDGPSPQSFDRPGRGEILTTLNKEGCGQVRDPQARKGRGVFDLLWSGPIDYESSLFDLLSNFPDRNRPKPNAAFSNRSLNRGCRFFEKAAIFADSPHPNVSIKNHSHPIFRHC